MNKYEKIPLIITEFDKLYPEAECSLNYSNVLELLISTMLSAQCTDARVNMVTPALFSRYQNVNDFAEADQKELEGYIFTLGFYHSKANNIILCCRKILQDYNGEVPSTMEELTSLPGVGRKTANLVLGDAFGQPSYVVDTHASRLCRRIGLTTHEDPFKIEMDLRELIPESMGNASSRFCHQLVLHGRNLCPARKPKCDQCPLYPLCDRVGLDD